MQVFNSFNLITAQSLALNISTRNSEKLNQAGLTPPPPPRVVIPVQHQKAVKVLLTT